MVAGMPSTSPPAVFNGHVFNTDISAGFLSLNSDTRTLLESVSVLYHILMVIYIPLHVSVLVALLVMGDGGLAGWGCGHCS